MPLLSVRDLVVRFRTHEGTVHAVNGVSFDLDEGETLGLVGESGCGKSVTCLSLIRLLPKPAGRVEGARSTSTAATSSGSPRPTCATSGARRSR